MAQLTNCQLDSIEVIVDHSVSPNTSTQHNCTSGHYATLKAWPLVAQGHTLRDLGADQ